MLHAVVCLSTKIVDRKYLYKKAIFRFSVKVLGSRILKSRHCAVLCGTWYGSAVALWPHHTEFSLFSLHPKQQQAQDTQQEKSQKNEESEVSWHQHGHGIVTADHRQVLPSSCCDRFSAFCSYT